MSLYLSIIKCYEIIYVLVPKGIISLVNNFYQADLIKTFLPTEEKMSLWN